MDEKWLAELERRLDGNGADRTFMARLDTARELVAEVRRLRAALDTAARDERARCVATVRSMREMALGKISAGDVVMDAIDDVARALEGA